MMHTSNANAGSRRTRWFLRVWVFPLLATLGPMARADQGVAIQVGQRLSLEMPAGDPESTRLVLQFRTLRDRNEIT